MYVIAKLYIEMCNASIFEMLIKVYANGGPYSFGQQFSSGIPFVLFHQKAIGE